MNGESEPIHRTKARAEFLMQLFARFEAASGKAIDTDEAPTRKRTLINELMLRRYGQREAEAAQEYILKGPPVRYGSLTLADFYPNREQLESVGFDYAGEIGKAERRARATGYDQGYHAAQRKADEERRAELESRARDVLSSDERAELEYLRGLTSALSEEMDRYRADEIKAERLRRIEERFTRTKETKDETEM